MKHVLYIPGLGGSKSLDTQKILLSWWNQERISIYAFDAQWHNAAETYDQKYSRLLVYAKNIALKLDDSFTVIGVSAGGSLALRYIVENKKVDSAFLVCGKLKGSSAIGKTYQVNSPALLKSVQGSETRIPNISADISAKITAIRPLLDNVVPLKDMLIPRCKRVRLLTVGHSISIGYALIVYLRLKI